MELIKAAHDKDINSLKKHFKLGRDINYISPITGRNCLHEACSQGNEEMVRIILSKKPKIKINAKCVISEDTALHYASMSGNKTIVQLLLDAGADINAVNRYHFSALHCAQNADIVLLLINSGIDPTIKSKYGLTAEHYFKQSNSTLIYSILKQEMDRRALEKIQRRKSSMAISRRYSAYMNLTRNQN